MNRAELVAVCVNEMLATQLTKKKILELLKKNFFLIVWHYGTAGAGCAVYFTNRRSNAKEDNYNTYV